MKLFIRSIVSPIVVCALLNHAASSLSSAAGSSRSISTTMSSSLRMCTASTICEGDSKIIYKELEDKLKEIEKLSGVKGLLGWDEMVMLKAGSANARNDQKSALSAVIFEKQTSKDLEALIHRIEQADVSVLTPFQQANVRDAIREFNHTTKKTKDMTTREAELEGRGYQTWAEARKQNSFTLYGPVLNEIIELRKEIATATHPHLSLYDGNIDLYERGMKAIRLDEIFTEVKRNIVPIIKSIKESSKCKNYVVPEPLKGGPLWEVEKQKELCAEIAEAIGFNFDKGRLDVSVHPFTGGSHPTDVRITTRYSPENWLEGIGGTVHEVGHALYEQGRNVEYDNTPVSRALSMGVHESQSLFWERMVFQSREFWQWATPIVHKHFPHTSSCTADDFYKCVNQVEPGLIRIEADEVTYPMHIILRFEVEKGLFDGSIEVSKLPEIWNSKMKQMLDVDVPSDAKGCLQDIHWSLGALGYFPSYTLGAMIAAQLMETMEKDIPSLRDHITRGEFHVLRDWLGKNIHQVGSLYPSPDELLISVTGKPLDPSIYVDYISKKYTELYSL